jgi:hypothetical protein
MLILSVYALMLNNHSIQPPSPLLVFFIANIQSCGYYIFIFKVKGGYDHYH